MRYFNWKKEKLIEAYMEDAEVTLEKAGIREGGAQPRLKRVRGFVCDVCYDDETKETLALTCDHRCEPDFTLRHACAVSARSLA